MLKANLMGTVALSTIALALAGCSSSGTVGGSTGGTTSAVAAYAKDVGTADEALGAGHTLYSDTGVNTATGRDAYCGSGTCSYSPTSATFALAQNGQGGIDVTINGETTSFSASDYNGHSWVQNEDDGSHLLASEGDVGNVDYHQAWGFQSSDASSDTTSVVVAVVGAETTADLVANKANATYSGKALEHLR